MKFALHNNLSSEYLRQADEILVWYHDRRSLPDLFNEYPQATIILKLQLGDTADWDEINDYYNLSKNHLICCLDNIRQDAQECAKRHIPFFWLYPVNNFYDLNALRLMGACYVYIAPPLTFQIKKAFAAGVPLRVIPNVAYEDYLPRDNGLHGGWFRPEDMKLLEPYVDVIEFGGHCDTDQEQALYRIYKRGEWSEDINTIIYNLGMPPTICSLLADTHRRLNCGQACQEGSTCHLCELDFRFAQNIQNRMN